MIWGMLCLPVASAASGFTVDGRRILNDGQPMEIRGVCYQPTPIGGNPAADQNRGDYFTREYAAIHRRDLPNLRALGANVLRVYNWDPAADHREFLDACYHGGVDPLYVLVNRWIEPDTRWSDTRAVDALTRDFLQIDENLGSHPAVLGIVLGNEANARFDNGGNPDFWHAMNRIAAAIKARTPGRLVSMAVTDALPQIARVEPQMSSLDFWSIQSYRGESFGSFFLEYHAVSGRPLVLTEFGVDAFDHRAGRPYADEGAYVAVVVTTLWREIAANDATCAGACVFEYADEWWKAAQGSASEHDAGGVPLDSLPDGYANEEWWGLYAVERAGDGPDRLSPRSTVAALQAVWRGSADSGRERPGR